METERGLGSTAQEAITREVLASVRGFLGGPSPHDDGWAFDFGEHLESNWGAVYGGALAAGALAVARSVVPDRSPRSLHLQMVRSVPRGRAFASAEVRHAGRTVGTVEVDLYDERGKLAAVALLTMVAPEAVAAEHHLTTAAPLRVTAVPVAPGMDWPAPITEALKLKSERDGRVVAFHSADVRPSVDGSQAAVGHCTLPWDELALTGPEGACLAADAIVALPVMESFVPTDSIGPNADLTLRFTTAPATRVLMTVASMLSVQSGTATVGIEVRAGDHQLAHGLATSLLLRRA